jgi:tetratricopeptide (TPR) repeat protein
MALYPDNTFMQNQYQSLQLNKLIREKGVEYLAENIETLKVEYNITNANVLNAIGYNLINNEDYEAAVAVFQINVNLYPEVANCYDSLAEGYMLLGNNQEAINNYQIAAEKLEADTTINEQFRDFLRGNIEERLGELKPS